MTSIASAIERAIRDVRREMRRLEPRVGVVSNVDTSGTHPVYTVDGVRMRSVETVAVGDLVFWLPGREPVILGEPK